MTDWHENLLADIIAQTGTDKRYLVAILLKIQDQFGYLPSQILEMIPVKTSITAGEIKGVMTFYSHFRLRPAGKHRINVCIGTACYVKGAEQTYQAFKEYLKIPDDDDTDYDRQFTIAKVACLGCCMLAPAVQIDDSIFGWVEPGEISRTLTEFERVQNEKDEPNVLSQVDDYKGEVKICLCSSCCASGANKIYNELLKWSFKYNFPVKTTGTGCTGISFAAPLIKITDTSGQVFYYGQLNKENLQPIMFKHFYADNFDSALEKVFYAGQDPAKAQIIDSEDHVNKNWFNSKDQIVMQNTRDFSPCDFDSYCRNGGFEALKSALELEPEKIISIISDSELRGRGGAGFPTGQKWAMTALAPGKEKFLVCNADEGDPGAFMDRMLLESVPFRVIEGMMIAAFAVDAKEGFIFVRREYPLAVERILQAIKLCQKNGLLAEKPRKKRFFIHLIEGAGAFVCGEETALLSAIEGNRGIPRMRPPYPSQKGLFSAPTLINNVETYCCVPWIINNGAKNFKKHGTKNSPGTKTFALAGKIKNGGLIEVPMGITIRQIINEIGDGVNGNADPKAVQIGGPSGGCVPEYMFDLPIDYEALSESGAIMGSGGLVVLDEYDCMVDIARYFLEFTADESCGNCSFCRIGSKKMLDILGRLCNARGKKGDLEKLEELALLVKQGSRCGLGKTSPNPVLTTLKYFRNEYESHIKGYCPAGKCQNMFSFSINDNCNGCMICARACPVKAIKFIPWEKAQIDNETCVRCGTCRNICPQKAVEVEKIFNENNIS